MRNALLSERFFARLATTDDHIENKRRENTLAFLVALSVPVVTISCMVTEVWQPARLALIVGAAFILGRQVTASLTLLAARGNRPSRAECMATHPTNRGGNGNLWRIVRERRAEWLAVNKISARAVPMVGVPSIIISAVPVMSKHDALGVGFDLGIIAVIAVVYWAVAAWEWKQGIGVADNPIPALAETVEGA